MEIILQQGCASLTGRLDSYSHYSIQRQGNRFFSKRNSKGIVPPDGHWCFITICAEQAGSLHIADIKVSQKEIMKALREMHKGNYFWTRSYPKVLNAAHILNLKERLEL